MPLKQSAKALPNLVSWRLSQEDRVLALQRQSLRQRHLPGSDDRVGEDPLGSLVGGTTSTSRGQGREESGELANDEPSREQQDVVSFANEAPAGPVRLELGMDAEVLDKILDEIEVGERSVFRFVLFVVLSLVVRIWHLQSLVYSLIPYVWYFVCSRGTLVLPCTYVYGKAQPVLRVGIYRDKEQWKSSSFLADHGGGELG